MSAVKSIEKLKIASCVELSPENTFDCGQAFRWNAMQSGAYFGVAFGEAAVVSQDGEDIFITCREGSFSSVWKEYFDLERDYAKIADGIENPKLRKAVEFGQGIRILRQEPWEALCSFIISQCNNITRIKGIVERLCMLCGEEKSFLGNGYYTFPSPTAVARLSEKELATLRAGYRAEYISTAAKLVASGEFDLLGVLSLPTDEAKAELLKLSGVGEKVASCVLLFGMAKLDAFPIDVWMRRAIKEFFGDGKFDYKQLGQYAGVVQQYMFHYMRNSK